MMMMMMVMVLCFPRRNVFHFLLLSRFQLRCFQDKQSKLYDDDDNHYSDDDDDNYQNYDNNDHYDGYDDTYHDAFQNMQIYPIALL